ncbi:elongation factor 1-gamma [Collybia nuda]|uniref:Elongation factor 1-gamma n=1 Tax=Collybia nuda TaxID=64659 RepID=A0A9P6CHX6_9AGAR|nr:elongation factor 1-gamma [Collybia nuda]
MSNTLWTIPMQAPGKTVRATAALAGIKVDLPAEYVHFTDNKKPEFLAKFPHGKIPAFEGADGVKIFEGSAIARYIAALAPNSGLLGGDLVDSAHVDQWVHLADTEVDMYTMLITQMVRGVIAPYNKPIHTVFSERQLRTLKTLDEHLATRTYFVGERITMADLSIASSVQRAAGMTIDTAVRAQIPNLIRHLETITNHPQLAAIYGVTPSIEKALQYVPPSKGAKSSGGCGPAKVEKVEKKPTPAKNDDDDDDDRPPPPPKVHNPLDDLPKSAFNLEDWKRAYSNKETRGPGGALEWFYEHFDKEGFSVWRFDFKYNEDLTHTFMSANQITGFFNRMEASRKYVFGSGGVLGENNNSVIVGVIVMRGQEHKPVMDVAPDWESYAYTKLDLANDADKAFFEAALAWDLEIDGKKWVDGKLLK